MLEPIKNLINWISGPTVLFTLATVGLLLLLRFPKLWSKRNAVIAFVVLAVFYFASMFDPNFFLIARTDAIQAEGVDAAIERCQAYVEAGADGIFAEAAYDLPTYKRFVEALKVPVLANITEFGATPLFTRDELASVGVAIQLYPLSAFRAANKAAESVYTSIRQNGHQKDVIELMQTRAELYDRIGYHAFEQKLDALFAAGKK